MGYGKYKDPLKRRMSDKYLLAIQIMMGIRRACIGGLQILWWKGWKYN